VKNLSLKSYHFSWCIKVCIFLGVEDKFVNSKETELSECCSCRKGPRWVTEISKTFQRLFTQLSFSLYKFIYYYFIFFLFQSTLLLLSPVTKQSESYCKSRGSTVGQTGTKWKWKLHWALWIPKMTEMSISYHLQLPREQCVVQVHAEWSIPRKEGRKEGWLLEEIQNIFYWRMEFHVG
jgi:hypothetical protein